MATTQTPLTPTSDQMPAVISVQDELSGSQWVTRFLGSNSTNDLWPTFKTAVDSFIEALNEAGASVHISATYRPPERAYLMHWSWIIAHGANASTATPMNGVHINWVHPTAAASRIAAQAMVDGYGIHNLQVPPALNTRHTAKSAIDMNILWSGTLKIKNYSGQEVIITTLPRTGMNVQLKAVGATYGVIKFVGGNADKPHWSTDGH
jgi:hypothetical protein